MQPPPTECLIQQGRRLVAIQNFVGGSDFDSLFRNMNGSEKSVNYIQNTSPVCPALVVHVQLAREYVMRHCLIWRDFLSQKKKKKGTTHQLIKFSLAYKIFVWFGRSYLFPRNREKIVKPS